MTKFFRCCYMMVGILLFIKNCYAIVIPTTNKNVDLYIGLFGSTNNPAQLTGCYSRKNDVFTGKQLIEYQYTVMDCVDGVTKLSTPGMLASADGPAIEDMDALMHQVLLKASAFQLGLNFSFNS